MLKIFYINKRLVIKHTINQYIIKSLLEVFKYKKKKKIKK